MIRKNKPSNEPPVIAVKFANIIFMLSIFFCILIVIYATYRIFNPLYDFNAENKGVKSFYINTILSSIIIATLFGYGLKIFSKNLKVNLSLLFFSLGITVYGFEIYLTFHHNESTRMKILNELRDSGVDAYPNTYPYLFFKSNGLATTNDRIYPLGGISNITTIFNNESGYYPIIKTDEHGFNNPKGLYIENKVDIMLIGDSFTEGEAVHPDENISAVLRESGFNTISVGKGGNGPLIELATLKEFAEPLKPKIILWLYFVNDLSDLTNEMESSFLKKYLNEYDYSQNLISRQEEIDDVLINYIPAEWKKLKEKAEEKRKNPIKLNKIRSMFNLTPTSTSPISTPISLSIFRDILKKSKQITSNWGGTIYFVYLPAFERYLTSHEHQNHDVVMQTINQLNISIIDIHSKVFEPHPDPLSLFPFRANGHYTAEGYRLIAKTIEKQLKVDGYISIESNK